MCARAARGPHHVCAPAVEKGAQDKGVKPWQALQLKYANIPSEVQDLLGRVRAKIPFVKGQGVCYINVQKEPPPCRAGTLHVASLNLCSMPVCQAQDKSCKC